ncbi:MAG: cellulase family glycosylhydrolase [Bacteroidales bacterium]|nr:cellulase family glycosylhydrolase [Bacteroidales bacterium]
MKKSISIAVILASMGMVSSCVSEDSFGDEIQHARIYRAVTERNVDSRTSLDGFKDILWSESDRLVIFEKTASASIYEIEAGDAGKTSADFAMVSAGAAAQELAHNVAFYPECAAECMDVGNDAYALYGVELPAVQSWQKYGFAGGAFPMAAVSTDTQLSFLNVCGGVRLQIKGTSVVRSLTFKGNADEYIAGDADVIVYADGVTVPQVKMQDTASKSITLDCGEGVQLSPDEATDFIITMPPTEFPSGFTVTVTAADGGRMTIRATVANTVVRSGLLKMPAFTFKPSEPEAVVLTECPFRRGINISDWMLHDTEDYVISNSYTEKDFHDLKSLGFDAVRLPVDFKNHVGASPDYVINDYLLECIDKAVNYAENAGLYIIIDNHSYLGESFPSEGPAVLKKVFAQVAQRYKDRSEKVIYELFNEPSASDMSLLLSWGTLQPALIDIIRAVDTKHSIVVSGFGSNIDRLEDIKDLADKDANLIYTFHFYAPALFTHQGADWNDSPMQYLSGPVPFPYNADEMPPKPDEFVSSYNEEDYDEYPSRGNVDYLKERLQVAVDFANTYGVPVYCGEWGVLNKLASQEDYCYYHEVVRGLLEENGIAWTLWAYRDDFSIFNRGSACVFENDLNLALMEALDLDIPEGYMSSMPAQVVFYDDVAASFTKPSSYNYDAEMTFDSRYSPCVGNRCIEWTLGGKYASVTFEIWPVADFSAQSSRDYELTFMIRCEESFPAPLTVRFVEYDEETAESWRYSFMLDNSVFASDGQWHEVRIPMSSFANAGGYRGSAWQNADSSRPCDWTKINKVEFAAEGQTALTGVELFLDEIRLVAPENIWYVDGFSHSGATWNW